MWPIRGKPLQQVRSSSLCGVVCKQGTVFPGFPIKATLFEWEYHHHKTNPCGMSPNAEPQSERCLFGLRI